jgi:hypothetical protein
LSQNYDDQSVLHTDDSEATFYLHHQAQDVVDAPSRSGAARNPKMVLNALQVTWPMYEQRSAGNEDEWMAGLGQHLDELVQRRLLTVQSWITANTSRFPDADASIGPLQRVFNQMANDIKASVQMCSLKCSECHLKCLQARNHDGAHDCSTNHRCTRTCHYVEAHVDDVPCGMSYVLFDTTTSMCILTNDSAGHPGVHMLVRDE